jgi:hypothetical protein
MKNIFKKLFSNETTESLPSDPPGRTFKRILTGDYFGFKKCTSDVSLQNVEKQKKIEQIKTHALQPKYINYTYQGTEVISAHVAFQKEVLAEKWNMLHITEISFTIYANDFEEFEEMSKVCLETDFRDVSVKSSDGYQGQERRQQMRD